MGKRLTLSKQANGFGMIEAVIAVAILSGAALVAFSFLGSTRLGENRLTNVMTVNNIAGIVGQNIVGRSAAGTVLNRAVACSTGGTVPDSASAARDPFCCQDGGVGDTHCYNNTPVRQLLCGSYDANAEYETQAMRTAATWARNIYRVCRNGTAGLCAITNNGGNICTGDGLVFDTNTAGGPDDEFRNFFNLLPDPINFANWTGAKPKSISLKIEVVTTTDIDTPVSVCPAEPAIWNRDHMMKVTFRVIVPGAGSDSSMNRDSVTSYSLHLAWPKEGSLNSLPFTPASPVNIQAGSEMLRSAGPDLALSSTAPVAGQALNIDNLVSTLAVPQIVYNKDMTVRATGTMCSGTLNGVGPYQNPGFVYTGWDQYIYGATSDIPGVTPYCRAPSAVPATLGTDLNVCCENAAVSNPVGVVVDESVAGAGTTYRVVFNTAFAEGQILPIGQMDSMGNKSLSKNIMFSPGYCPATNTYCADGNRTGIEVNGQAAAAYPLASSGPLAAPPGGGCPAEGSWGPVGFTGAYTPDIGNPRGDIFCRPHDGCWSLCPIGTRSAQRCPVSTSAYCSFDNDGVSAGTDVGNWDPASSRGCGAASINPQGGIDCTTDNRCTDSTCDDCGNETCTDSTLPVTVKVPLAAIPAPFPVAAGPWGNYTPYNDATNFPTPYIGVELDPIGGCPARNTYCPVGARSPASSANPPASGIYYLPKDNCGNSCPDGNRTYQTCPVDQTTYCSLAPVIGVDNQDRIRVAVPGSYGGPRGPRCTGAQCSGLAPNNTPVDDCNQYCLPSTYVEQSVGCPSPATYCPDSTPLGAIPSPLNGGSGPNWLPHDYCGNDCPVGTLPAPDGTARDNCLAQSAYCYDPTGGGGPSNCVGAIQPGSEPKDVCGRTCLMTTCTCPLPADVCLGVTYNSTAGPCSAFVCSVAGTKPWTTQSKAQWCPTDGLPITGPVDSAGHLYATSYCDDIYTGHHDVIDANGTLPTTCPTEQPLWCVGDAVNDSCGDPCAGGGTKTFSACTNASYCGGEAVPDSTCVDGHGTHAVACGTGSVGWSGCAAQNTQICGTPINNTCTDAAHGAHSAYCGYNGNAYNVADCTARRPGVPCNVNTTDSCGNSGCGNGSACMTWNQELPGTISVCRAQGAPLTEIGNGTF